MGAAGPVAVERREGLALLRLQGRHGNAINEDMIAGLRASLADLEGDGGVRGALLASSHPKMFCPGLDLRELVAFDRARMKRFMLSFSDCLVALYRFGRPLVAALSGHTVAGGCVLALTADRRILRPGALIGLNEVQVGVPLPLGPSLILRDGVHAARIDEVALLGNNFSDREAVDIGLAQELGPEEGFEEHCLSRLEEYASRDSQAFALTKRHLREDIAARIESEEEATLEGFLDCWFSEATRERMREIVARIGRG
jgi:enoyl-CoA hydratase/carnithine racemase